MADSINAKLIVCITCVWLSKKFVGTWHSWHSYSHLGFAQSLMSVKMPMDPNIWVTYRFIFYHSSVTHIIFYSNLVRTYTIVVRCSWVSHMATLSRVNTTYKNPVDFEKKMVNINVKNIEEWKKRPHLEEVVRKTLYRCNWQKQLYIFVKDGGIWNLR